MFRRRQGGRGFTLIELLVVVSVIAILIGVLLPSLARARKSAQNVVSLSNIRSLGQTFAVYAVDFRDELINPFFRTTPPEDLLNTVLSPCENAWASVMTPQQDDGWCFGDAPGLGQLVAEMYAAHWISRTGTYLGAQDNGLAIQFHPGDLAAANRFEDTISGGDDSLFDADSGGDVRQDIVWDSSYYMTPTAWFAPERYPNEPGISQDEQRLSADFEDPIEALAKRNRFADISNPVDKVLIFERFDFSKNSRTQFRIEQVRGVRQPYGSAQISPQWNNPGAEVNVSTADLSATRVNMANMYSRWDGLDEDSNEAFGPPDSDVWAPGRLLGDYEMENDGLETFGTERVEESGYPAWFWSTRDGLRGRDITRSR